MPDALGSQTRLQKIVSKKQELKAPSDQTYDKSGAEGVMKEEDFNDQGWLSRKAKCIYAEQAKTMKLVLTQS